MSETGNRNVGVLAFQTSVVVKGIEKKLASLDCNVKTLVGDFQQIRNLLGQVDLFITYLPDNLLDDAVKMKELGLICSTILEGQGKMVLIGEEKYHEDLTGALPVITSFGWLNRPVETEQLRTAIERTLSSANATTSQKKRILLVDDDPAYAKMVREWLKDFFRVDIVTAGMQAISYLLKIPEGEKVDLILLDYEMPIVDGPQVFQMLRQNPETASIPVIFLTGVGTREGVSRVMELKPEGYVLKSTTRKELLAYLNGRF